MSASFALAAVVSAAGYGAVFGDEKGMASSCLDCTIKYSVVVSWTRVFLHVLSAFLRFVSEIVQWPRRRGRIFAPFFPPTMSEPSQYATDSQSTIQQPTMSNLHSTGNGAAAALPQDEAIMNALLYGEGTGVASTNAALDKLYEDAGVEEPRPSQTTKLSYADCVLAVRTGSSTVCHCRQTYSSTSGARDYHRHRLRCGRYGGNAIRARHEPQGDRPCQSDW